ncbi:MAG: MMPL family transporter [Bacteroidetes bacterium]|nr:MMPL family transporter [Bacteroidota bacterium]
MWKALTKSLLRNRIAYITVVLMLTVFFGWQATKVELSYNFAKILPPDDSSFVAYQEFKKNFGEDGNVMAVGIQPTDVFEPALFNDWIKITKEIKKVQGIKEVLSLGSAYNMEFDDSLEKFNVVPLITKDKLSTGEVAQLKGTINSLPFYEGVIYNQEKQSTLLAITFDDKELNSSRRIGIVEEIEAICDSFSVKHKTEVHYSGMPYIRSAVMKKVSGEMKLFSLLAILVTALVLWFFFRSFSTVIFSLLVVIVGVVWALGIMHLMGYKITILSGLLPPLIIVIGIPNCIFFINRYHKEYLKHHNKIKGISRMIETMAITLFLANITTAIGFAVLYFTNTELLVEFGLVSAVNVVVTYLITLIMIPIILSYLPEPKTKHTKHVEAKRINWFIGLIDNLIQHKRKQIYIVTALITGLGFWGMSQMSVVGFVVDDLPEKEKVYRDLKFFEANFNGILPFEITIDTKKPNGVFADNAKIIYKIKSLQKLIAKYDDFSGSLSIAEGIKFSYQAYRGGDKKYYMIPSIGELKKLSDFSGTVKGKENKFKAYIDTSKQVTRLSYRMKDIGSQKTKELVADLRPKIDSIFKETDANVSLTGHSLTFLKGNDYLLDNLIESLLIEIILIALVGLALFRSWKIIVLSKLPCLIPLVITAGIMGFLDIRFKPSTILIFSIAFGIASDGTIYFLTRYRQELKNNKKVTVPEAISICVKDLGVSMVYTAIILFSGFSIFIWSSFGGTMALGVLISLTLLVSMCTNLILLPAILISLANVISRKEIEESNAVVDEEDEADFNVDSIPPSSE